MNYILWVCLSVAALVGFACGPATTTTVVPAPTPANAPGYEAAQAVVDEDCAACHNGVFQKVINTPDRLKAAVLAEVVTGGMPPPPAELSPDDRATLVAFAQGTAK